MVKPFLEYLLSQCSSLSVGKVSLIHISQMETWTVEILLGSSLFSDNPTNLDSVFCHLQQLDLSLWISFITEQKLKFFLGFLRIMQCKLFKVILGLYCFYTYGS